jgi:hypothetical protein
VELAYPEQHVARGYLQYVGAHATDSDEEPLKIYKYNCSTLPPPNPIILQNLMVQ